jgi:hypothetical protein
MPSCTGCVLQVAEVALVCPACKAPTRRGRKRWLLIGAALALAPVVFYSLWIVALGSDFVAKKAPFYGIDERVVYVNFCLIGGFMEIVALWFLDRTVRRPIDLLTIGAALFGILSILATLFLFGLCLVLPLAGW